MPGIILQPRRPARSHGIKAHTNRARSAGIVEPGVEADGEAAVAELADVEDGVHAVRGREARAAAGFGGRGAG